MSDQGDTPMIEIRVRCTSETEAIHLCTWPAERLDDVVPTVQKWGVSGFDDAEITGQFVLGRADAFFEITIHDED